MSESQAGVLGPPALKERTTILCIDEGGDVVVRIRDTGCGMPAETLKKLFEPFFTTKPVGKGTGLGLHVAYKIVEAHGGRIDVRSEPGAGTEFAVFLPVRGPRTGGIP